MKLIQLAGFIGLLCFIGLISPVSANAFIGPSAGQTPGSGGGLFQVDANRNIGFGTASGTPVSTFNSTSTESGPSTFGYIFTVASTTNPGLSLKNLTSGNTYVWSSRNFGNLQLYRESATLAGYVVIDINQYGDVAIGQKATSTGGVARLFVGGNIQATGALSGSNYAGQVPAGNVASGVFGSLQGNGNFAFPAALAVGTTTTAGLPTDGLAVLGNVGIGTTTPATALTITRDTWNDGPAVLVYRNVNTGAAPAYSWVQGYGTVTDLGFSSGNFAGNIIGGIFYARAKISGTGTNTGGTGFDRNVIGVWGEADNIGPNAVQYLTGVRSSVYLDANVTTGIGMDVQAPTRASTETLTNFYGVKTQNDPGWVSNYYHFYGGTGGKSYFGHNVGIATTTPTSPLTVVGVIESTSGGFKFPDGTTMTTAASGSGDSNWTLSGSNLYASSTSWNVGIGNTSPGSKLEVTGNIELSAGASRNIFANQSSGVFSLQATTASNNGPTIELYGPSHATDAGNIKIIAYGSSTAEGQIHFMDWNGTTWNTNMVIEETGNVGIASSSPGYGLTVVGTGYFSQPVIVGTPTQTSHAATKNYVDSSISGGSASSSAACAADATCEMNGADLQGGDITGVDKLTATVIDPIYQIGETKYSTYVADTIGLKTEVYGKAELNKTHSYTIDFNKTSRGSDLWLFWQTIYEGKDMEDMIVNLTPEFNGRVWYELKPATKQLIIYGSGRGSVSYHVVAPRQDAKEWANLTKDQTERPSFILQGR